MTDRTRLELALVAAALARHALRIDDKHTRDEARREQHTLLADLDRDELAVVALDLADIVAEVTEGFAKARSGSAERLLERIVQRVAAEAANRPDVGDQGGGD
ncbi:MAG: hypothetical protein ACRDP9_25840 [Kribbellaceae bacterium]